ncbi:MAG: sugar porter family MFS transporter [Thermoguttaceae bacterium]
MPNNYGSYSSQFTPRSRCHFLNQCFESYSGSVTIVSTSQIRMTRYNFCYISVVCFVATLGGLLFGYDWVVIGGAKPFFEKFFHIESEHVRGWTNSCALLGCLIGALGTSALAEKWGRKKALLLAAFLFAISSILTGWAFAFTDFIIWRIVGGIAIGMAAALAPVYIAEISPAEYRGRLVAFNQLAIVTGILLAQIVNWQIVVSLPASLPADQIAESWFGQYAWRWMFTAVAVPSIFFFVGLLFIPESPRWLVVNGKPEQARTIFVKIGGETYADTELNGIQNTIVAEKTDSRNQTASHDGGFRLLLEPQLFVVLLSGCFLAVLQQWSGINVLFNYAEEIFSQAGYDVKSIMFTIILTGIVNLLATVIAILCVDRFGRRQLMLLGCAGIACCHVVTALACYGNFQGLAVVVPILLALVFYGLSLAPVTWVLISEIFPSRIRTEAVAISTAALWIACFVLTYTFPPLAKMLGAANVFLVYAGICLVGFGFVYTRIPETKGKSLEQIEREITCAESNK